MLHSRDSGQFTVLPAHCSSPLRAWHMECAAVMGIGLCSCCWPHNGTLLLLLPGWWLRRGAGRSRRPLCRHARRRRVLLPPAVIPGPRDMYPGCKYLHVHSACGAGRDENERTPKWRRGG